MTTSSITPQEQHPQFGKMNPKDARRTLSYKPYSQIVYGESLDVLSRIRPSTVDLVYFDPPSSSSLKVDDPEEYLEFLEPRLLEAYRVLMYWGWMYVHLDRRDVYIVTKLLSSIFGQKSCMNEFLWTYYYGKMSEYRWPDTPSLIVAYAKYPQYFIFHPIAVEYDARRTSVPGEYPTEFLLHIPALPEEERTGYPGQQPLESLKRIIAASTNPGDLVLDFFAGSGTTGEAAHRLGRKFILADNDPDAVGIMAKRFNQYKGIQFEGFEPGVHP